MQTRPILKNKVGILSQLDWILLIPILILLTISVLTLKSLPSNKTGLQLWQVQLIAIFVGALIMWPIIKSRANWWQKNNQWIYWASLILMILVLIFGVSIAGAKRWISIGGLFDIQSAEIAKFALVLLLARYLSRQDLTDVWRLVGSMFYAGVMVFLVLLEPDLDNAILLLSLLVVMLLVGGVAKKYLIVIGLMALLCLPIFIGRLHTYQKQRLTSFVNQDSDNLGSNYNLNQAKIAIGSGGLSGEGIGGGSQTDLKFLPAESTDFIFSAVAEKLGFIGGITIILCLSVITIRIWWLALGAGQTYIKLCLTGVGWILGFEAIINIGMNLGLLPVSGIQLPFVSYGGTHIVLELAMIGFVFMQSRQVYKNIHPNTLQTPVRLLP